MNHGAYLAPQVGKLAPSTAATIVDKLVLRVMKENNFDAAETMRI